MFKGTKTAAAASAAATGNLSVRRCGCHRVLYTKCYIHIIYIRHMTVYTRRARIYFIIYNIIYVRVYTAVAVAAPSVVT